MRRIRESGARAHQTRARIKARTGTRPRSRKQQNLVSLVLGWNQDARSDRKEVRCPGEISQSAITKYHRPGDFNNRNLLLYNSGV